MTTTTQTKKQYIISKNVSPDDMREIRENFEDPSKYLSLDSKIVVGIAPFKTKKDIPNILPPRPVSTQTQITHRPQTTSNIIANKVKKLSRPVSSMRHIPQTSIPSPYNIVSQRPLSSSIHYELNDKEKLEMLFKESKQREIESIQKGTDNYIPNKAMENVKENYINQEKLLKRKNKERVQSARLSKKISKLSSKKEDDLLMNRVDFFRFKKEILNKIK